MMFSSVSWSRVVRAIFLSIGWNVAVQQG